jgi:hypothetical protein
MTMQLMALLKQLKPLADSVTVIEGRKTVSPDKPEAVSIRKFFGDGPLYEYATVDYDEEGWRLYPELMPAVEYIEGKLAALPGGGADVLIGFSQGSAMISLVSALAEQRGTPFRCVVLLAALLPGYARAAPPCGRPDLFEKKLTTPALLAHAPDDELIRSKGGDVGPVEVAKLWEPACVAMHEHLGPGHRPLPADMPNRNTLVEAIVAHVAKHCAP